MTTYTIRPLVWHWHKLLASALEPVTTQTVEGE